MRNTTKEPLNTPGFNNISLSRNDSINDLAKQQEKCLLNLIAKIQNPFQDMWDWVAWKRQAIALQLGNFNYNELWLESRQIWGKLLKDAKTEEGEPIDEQTRNDIIFCIHNHLERTFAQARQELSKREGGKDE